MACLSDSLKSFTATKGSAKVIFHSSGMLSIFECLFLKLPYRSHIVESEGFLFFFFHKVYKAGRGTLKVSKSSENALNAHSLYSETFKKSSQELHEASLCCHNYTFTACSHDPSTGVISKTIAELTRKTRWAEPAQACDS